MSMAQTHGVFIAMNRMVITALSISRPAEKRDWGNGCSRFMGSSGGRIANAAKTNDPGPYIHTYIHTLSKSTNETQVLVNSTSKSAGGNKKESAFDIKNRAGVSLAFAAAVIHPILFCNRPLRFFSLRLLPPFPMIMEHIPHEVEKWKAKFSPLPIPFFSLPY